MSRKQEKIFSQLLEAGLNQDPEQSLEGLLALYIEDPEKAKRFYANVIFAKGLNNNVE